MLQKIKKNEGLLFVTVDTVFYGDGGDTYTIIDAVSAQEPWRLKFVNAKEAAYSPSNPKDLFDEMIDYQKIVAELIVTNQSNSFTSCPVYHCTLGFENPKTKPYLSVFTNGVRTQKKRILNTLLSDPVSLRREAAAYLVGHFDDPKCIVSVLEKSLNDKSSEVRNAVMRVLAATLMKSATTTIDIKPVVDILNSPFEAERNKALAILLAASGAENNKKFIISNTQDNLIKLLALKQPNQHEMAYLLLKQISGKKFAERDITAWKNWLKQAQSKSEK